MKGRNWREYEPEVRLRRKRRRRGGFIKKVIPAVVLFCIGFVGFRYYYLHSKPYVIALDAGHGGNDPGAEGIIQEVELTERTVNILHQLLEDDGRFRVILSRKAGEGKTVTERSEKFQKYDPDFVISVHANASDDASAKGFECYPSPPGMANFEKSLVFAQYIAEEMGNIGARLRGTEGVRFGYYVQDENGNEEKLLVDATDREVYDYDTFGMLKHMECPTVLIEQCFVTNQEEVNEFASEEGCQKSAEAYYRAICRYIEENIPKSDGDT